MNPLINVMLPRLSKKDTQRAYSDIRKRFVYMVILGVVVSIVGIVVSPTVILILFTETYAEAIFFTQILFLSLIVGIPNMVIYALLQSQKETRKLYILNTSASAIEIAATGAANKNGPIRAHFFLTFKAKLIQQVLPEPQSPSPP